MMCTTTNTLLSQWDSHIWETNSYWSRNLFLPWNPKVHHRVHNSQPLFYILSQMNPVQSLQHYFFKINFNIIFTATHMPSEWSLFFKLSDRLSVSIKLGSYAYYMSHPSDNFIIPITFGKDYKLRSSLLGVFLHHHIASSLFSQTTALLFFYLRCNNSILCFISSPSSYRRGRQWHRVFTLWSLNEGQIRSRVGGGVNKKN